MRPCTRRHVHSRVLDTHARKGFWDDSSAATRRPATSALGGAGVHASLHACQPRRALGKPLARPHHRPWSPTPSPVAGLAFPCAEREDQPRAGFSFLDAAHRGFLSQRRGPAIHRPGWPLAPTAWRDRRSGCLARLTLVRSLAPKTKDHTPLGARSRLLGERLEQSPLTDG